MPRVKFGPGSASSFTEIAGAIDTAAFDSTLTKVSSKVIKLTSDAGDTVIRGNSFSTTMVGEDTILSGGNISRVIFTAPEADVSQIKIFKVGLTVPELFGAIAAESTGTDITALEDLFLGLDWTYLGKDNDDVLPDGTTSADGVPFNLQGNDVIKLAGGDDVFFSGDGIDRIFGGNGNDDLAGGADRDKVFGGADDDILYGGDGLDRLDGGAGADDLFGGSDRDKLKGGTEDDVLDGGGGNDVMFGGPGADIFVFADGDGADKVRDFDADDTLDMTDVASYTATVKGRGVLIEYDGGSVMLRGVDEVPVDQIA